MDERLKEYYINIIGYANDECVMKKNTTNNYFKTIILN